MNLTIVAILLYAVGAFFYYISNGWFRKTLLFLGATLGSIYILFLLVIAIPSHDPYVGMAQAYFLMFTSPPGLPATGVLFALLGDKLVNLIENKYVALSLKLLCLAIVPIIILIFLI